MAPRSLFEQAKIATIRNIEMLTDIGELPYSFMRPILLKLENPDQLRQLEKTCPQILGEDGEIWLKFIKRDVPGWGKKPHEPTNPKSWWKVYKKLKTEAEEENSHAEEMLRKKMEELQKKRESNTIAAPDRMIPERVSRQRPASTAFKRTADKSQLRFTTGSKTKNIMDRARRETAEAKLQRKGALVTPTHLLNVKASKVSQAPQHMMDQRRLEASRPEATPVFKLSRAASMSRDSRSESSSSGLAEREARLKALQSGGTIPSSVHSSLAPGMTYKVPHLGRPASPFTGTASPARSASPAVVKRKREVDIFMKSKKR